MKTAPDENNCGSAKHENEALGNAEKDSGSAKHDNGTRHLGTVKNESGSAKPENGTRRHRYR
jgi:hypothetical protein